jgi:hypothetical protein
LSIVTTCVVCITAYLCIHRITKTGLHLYFTRSTKDEIVELPEETTGTSAVSLDGVISELNDAFGILTHNDEEGI